MRTPGNVNAFNSYFEEVTSVQIYDMEDAILTMIYVPEQDPFSLNFQNAGYDSNLFLVTGASFLLNFLIHISTILLLLILWVCEKKVKSIKK